MAGLKVGISSDEASAIVQADSTSKGVLFPRMSTAQRDVITLPATGLLIYNVTTNQFEFYDGVSWESIGVSDHNGEIFLSAAGGWPSTTSGCSDPTKNEYGIADIDMYSLDFDAIATEYAQWTVWMPDDWTGDALTYKVVWTAGGGTPTETVKWNLQGRSYANNDLIDVAWGAATEVSDALIAANDIHITDLSGSVIIAAAGLYAGGEVLQFRMYRNAGGDSLSVDAKLLGIKIYYTRE